MKNFDENGWLTPVVNPNSFGQEGSKSPEGQAFVVMMYVYPFSSSLFSSPELERLLADAPAAREVGEVLNVADMM